MLEMGLSESGRLNYRPPHYLPLPASSARGASRSRDALRDDMNKVRGASDLLVAYQSPTAKPDTAEAANVLAFRAARDLMAYVSLGQRRPGGRPPLGGIGTKRQQLNDYTSEAWRIAEANAQNDTMWCEVGFGSGQSTAALLAAHPRIRTLTFDLFPLPATEAGGKMGSWTAESMFSQQHDAIRFISIRWPHRAERIAGNSNHSIASFAKLHPGFKCDLVSVDGWHGSPEVYEDITSMGLLARAGALLFIDDMERPPLRADALRAAHEGTITQPACKASGVARHQFCMSSYTTRRVQSI